MTRNGDNIILNMPSNITFDVDQHAVKPGFYQTLNSVAVVLRKFNRTLADVNGHTDLTGGLQYNQICRSAAPNPSSVISAARHRLRRMSAVGFGLSQPVASNASKLAFAEPLCRNPDRADHPG